MTLHNKHSILGCVYKAAAKVTTSLVRHKLKLKNTVQYKNNKLYSVFCGV
jgi:hypothetical protein